MEIKYLRKKDSEIVHVADSVLLKRNDMFPCDVNGKFISSGSESLEIYSDEFERAKEDLYNRADLLSIRNYKRMKFTTLIDKIVRKETEIALRDKG